MVVAGTAAGVFIGILYLWQFRPSWRAFFASVAAGAAAGAVFGFAAALPGTRTRLQSFGIAVLSGGIGGIGGIAWWLVAEPNLEIYWLAAIGAGGAATIALLAEMGINI